MRRSAVGIAPGGRLARVAASLVARRFRPTVVEADHVGRRSCPLRSPWLRRGRPRPRVELLAGGLRSRLRGLGLALLEQLLRPAPVLPRAVGGGGNLVGGVAAQRVGAADRLLPDREPLHHLEQRDVLAHADLDRRELRGVELAMAHLGVPQDRRPEGAAQLGDGEPLSVADDMDEAVGDVVLHPPQRPYSRTGATGFRCRAASPVSVLAYLRNLFKESIVGTSVHGRFRGKV